MLRTILIALLFSASAIAASPARAQQGGCPPAGYDRARLEALQAAQWDIPSARERRRFARAIVACLASPDPFLRDAVGFEALSHMLRARQLDAATQSALVDDVLARFVSSDPSGFERPFAALTLSELVRAERIDPYFTDAKRSAVTDAALAFFSSVRDYRGFDETDGWRHGVAHGADLLLQIALNERTGRDDLLRIREAIAGQIAPEAHFYIYGEPERLMRPILYMAQRGLISEAEWSAWLAPLATPHADLFTSQAGLAWRHNTTAFLLALYANARLNEDARDDVLLPGVEAALRALP